MPIILLILLVILVAQVGFWDALSAVLGGTLIFFLFAVFLAAAIAIFGYLVFRLVRR